MIDRIKKIFNNIISDKKRLLIFIGLIIVIIIVFVFVFGDKDVLIGVIKNPDGIDFHNEYEKLNDELTDDGERYPEVNIPANNKFEYSDVDEIIDVFNKKKDAVIYFGYSSCLYCRTAIQVLYDVSEDTEIDKIYYLDVTKKDDRYDELLNMLDYTFLNDSKEELDEIYAPLVMFVAEGKVVSYRKGTVYSQNSPYDILDKSQITGLSEIYRYGIRDVLNSIRNRNNSGNENS